MSENVPSDLCTQRRFRSACTFVQSYQNLHWIAKNAKFLHANKEDSDQTVQTDFESVLGSIVRRYVFIVLLVQVSRWLCGLCFQLLITRSQVQICLVAEFSFWLNCASVVSVPNVGSRGTRFEFCWDYMVLHCTEPFIITIPSSRYDLTLVMLNKFRCHAHFQFSASQITWSRLLIQIHILNDGKQCRSRSVGFCRSQLIWIYFVKTRYIRVQQD